MDRKLVVVVPWIVSKTSLAIGWGPVVVPTSKSNNVHVSTGFALFTPKLLRRSIFWWYCRSLVYYGLTQRRQSACMYRINIVAKAREKIWKTASKMQKAKMDRGRTEHSVCIASAPFGTIWYNNDSWYSFIYELHKNNCLLPEKCSDVKHCYLRSLGSLSNSSSEQY